MSASCVAVRTFGPTAATATRGTGRTCSRTVVTVSTSRRSRSPAEPHGWPKSSASRAASGRPVPMPSSNRPAETSCRAAASRATTAAVRKGAARTQVPRRSVDVAAAAAASAGKGDGVKVVSGRSIVA